jgi:hypothetical protein
MARRRPGALLAVAALLLGAPARAQPAGERGTTYDVLYDARISPTERSAHVSITIGRGADKVHRVLLRAQPDRQFDFQGDGEIETGEEGVTWIPPRGGGTLRYTFRIDHLRDTRSYDARCTKSWAIFRGDDLVPPTRVLYQKGARSRSRLRLRVPDGWSAVAPYPPLRGGDFAVSHPHRKFDRPTGWIVAGELGVVREEVEGVKVAIAGPVKHGLRRLDMLALLRWTLPSLHSLLGELPDRFLIVGAGDPMWRGGLSAPGSVFVHARRPLIQEDGTSPLLHEMMHVLLALSPGPGGDWIVEGLAELYSLELLLRSTTLSPERIDKALAHLRERGRSVAALEVNHASGAVTARAVTVLRDLDRTIRDGTQGARGLDDVVRRLAREGGKITTERLRTLAGEVSGLDLAPFFEAALGTP